MDRCENNTEVPQGNLKEPEGPNYALRYKWLDEKSAICKTFDDIYKVYREWKKVTEYEAPELPPKERKPSKTKSRAWFMTINNPTKDDFKRFAADEFEFCTLQMEVGQKLTAHIHATIYYKNARVCPVKKYPRAKIELPRESLKACIKYCRKEKTRILGPWTFGEEPKQGERKDLNVLRDRIMQGESVDDLMMENPAAFHEYGRTLNRIEEVRMMKTFRTERTLCLWYWGETGTGKSFRAFTKFSPITHYRYPYDNGWWDNYRQQPVVILNEFRGDTHIPFYTMLELLDETPMDVKRRHRPPMPFTSRLVIVTSPLPPEKVFGRVDKDDNFDQFKRRVHVINLKEKYQGIKSIEFDDINKIHTYATGVPLPD